MYSFSFLHAGKHATFYVLNRHQTHLYTLTEIAHIQLPVVLSRHTTLHRATLAPSKALLTKPNNHHPQHSQGHCTVCFLNMGKSGDHGYTNHPSTLTDDYMMQNARPCEQQQRLAGNEFCHKSLQPLTNLPPSHKCLFLSSVHTPFLWHDNLSPMFILYYKTFLVYDYSLTFASLVCIHPFVIILPLKWWIVPMATLPMLSKHVVLLVFSNNPLQSFSFSSLEHACQSPIFFFPTSSLSAPSAISDINSKRQHE